MFGSPPMRTRPFEKQSRGASRHGKELWVKCFLSSPPGPEGARGPSDEYLRCPNGHAPGTGRTSFSNPRGGSDSSNAEGGHGRESVGTV
jgi:hypothetical protein